MGTVMQSKPQRNDTRQARWDRLERASLFEPSCELQDQGPFLSNNLTSQLGSVRPPRPLFLTNESSRLTMP